MKKHLVAIIAAQLAFISPTSADKMLECNNLGLITSTYIMSSLNPDLNKPFSVQISHIKDTDDFRSCFNKAILQGTRGLYEMDIKPNGCEIEGSQCYDIERRPLYLG